jgi:hypothetical protein
MIFKVFLTKSGKANFTCPECGHIRQMDVTKFKKMDREVKLKCTCKCQNVFSVILERRRHIRKKVHLPGELLMGKQKYPININDISKVGLKIHTKDVLDLDVEDKIILEFILDDTDNSKVSKEVIVKKINQTQIGGKFSSKDHYDKLGTYLLFHFD